MEGHYIIYTIIEHCLSLCVALIFGLSRPSSGPIAFRKPFEYRRVPINLVVIVDVCSQVRGNVIRYYVTVGHCSRPADSDLRRPTTRLQGRIYDPRWQKASRQLGLSDRSPVVREMFA